MYTSIITWIYTEVIGNVICHPVVYLVGWKCYRIPIVATLNSKEVVVLIS